MTALELRLALYGGILAALAIGILIWRHHDIAEGESIIKAADAVAVQKQTAAVAAQKAQDAADAKEVSDALTAQIGTLQQRLAAPATVFRLCSPTRYADTVPASGTFAGSSQPGHSADGIGDSRMLSGSTAGPDVGSAVQLIEAAAELDADLYQSCRSWALKQAAP